MSNPTAAARKVVDAVRMVADNAVRVTPLTGAIGASVSGINLCGLSKTQFKKIREVFWQHCILVFRGQSLSIQDHIDFAQRWGEMSITPMVNYVDGHHGVLPLHNRGKANEVNENWHSDSTFMERPPAITILVARDIPEAGGDTMWCNQYRAYETLSDGMRGLLDGLQAKFTGTRLAKLHKYEGDVPWAYHPVVRTHPETGRKALYIGHPGDTVPHFKDMTEAESRPLLDFLYAHATTPDNIYRHMWRPGDVVMWDNRCAMHYAVHDYGKSVRNLHRITIQGDIPV